MGEDDASTEGAKLSGAWKSGGTVCGHNSGESRLGAEGARKRFLISQAKGQSWQNDLSFSATLRTYLQSDDDRSFFMSL